MLIAIINTYQILKWLLTNNKIALRKIIPGTVVSREKILSIKLNTLQSYLFPAIKHLNQEKLENRLTVIYDLEQLSQNYPQYLWEVMELLTNFVQNQAAQKNRDQFNPNPSPTISLDIQVALTVIGRRNTHQDQSDGQLDLSHTDMRGANLNQANLELTNLYQVNLSQANLSGANLSGAILSAANLSGANLSGANFQQANLYLANLQGATLSDAILKGANLREANFG